VGGAEIGREVLPLPELVLAFAVGHAAMILRFRSGASGAWTALTYALTAVGVPLALALVAVGVYRLFAFWRRPSPRSQRSCLQGRQSVGAVTRGLRCGPCGCSSWRSASSSRSRSPRRLRPCEPRAATMSTSSTRPFVGTLALHDHGQRSGGQAGEVRLQILLGTLVVGCWKATGWCDAPVRRPVRIASGESGRRRSRG
jgi:hypothetical protein